MKPTPTMIAEDYRRAVRRARARLPYGHRRLGPKHPASVEHGPHTRRFVHRQTGALVLIHATQRTPWEKRADNRRRGKAARIARRANR